ncbi:hypothetical protein [Aureivirga sp. CE67]|uniref:hypothetical protein n=1 Tax=Aureivirga sp. CE67 TaxID=1788983 RepID=UPI0018C9AEEF|nr:hypothetical protein [Aureivirga sp. CE67]
MLKKIFTFSIITIFISCDMTENSKAKKNTSEKKKEITQETNSLDSTFNIKGCAKYWKQISPMEKEKKVLIQKIYKENQGNELNNKFLKSYLDSDWKIEMKKNNYDKHLFPIYRLFKDDVGIVSHHANNSEKNKIVKHITEIPIEKEINLVYYPEYLDSIFKNKKKPTIYTYSEKGRETKTIKDFGFGKSRCLQYYEYSYEPTDNPDKNVVFGSPFKLDLEYQNYPEIDAILHENFMKNCYDCPSNDDQLKTFAKLKGYKNLYFAYADSFPINNQLEYPTRVLVYISDDNKMTFLWDIGLDLLGCGCV